MSYKPKSEETLAKEGLLVDGDYDFECVETWDKPTKIKADGSGGNPMFTLKHHIFDEAGNTSIITDYIALGNNFGERKLRHAADAAGLLDIYESGKLVPSDFKGRCGKAKVKTQEGTADYPLPKNVISDYIKRPIDFTEPAKLPKDVEDDGIPFAWAALAASGLAMTVMKLSVSVPFIYG